MSANIFGIGTKKYINDVDPVKEFGRDIYKEKGYESRWDYLQSLAEDYCVSEDVVMTLADLLGPCEDFDGLISSLSDYECMC